MKIFRKIRQAQLTKNKIGKYLLYAIGEIILVVIGILIALAINNNNQNRVTLEKEQIYLAGLKEEFQTSKLKLSKLIDVNKNNFNGAKRLLEYISDSLKTPTETEFSELLFNTFSSDITFNPNNSLLNEIINSGSLKDISNTQLRIQLTNWVSTIDDVSRQEHELSIQREKVLDLFRGSEYNLRTIFDLTDAHKSIGLQKLQTHSSNLMLLQSQAFENNVLLFILTSRSMEAAHYQPLLEDLNNILDLIDSEIKS